MEEIFDGLGQLLFTLNNSTFIIVVKILAALYLAVLIVDIVLLIILVEGGALQATRKLFTGADYPITRGKYRRRWQKISLHFESEMPSHWKAAVLEADQFVNEVLQRIGYKGKNLSERLRSVPSSQLRHKDDVLAAHHVRNQIVHEENFSLSKNQAEKIFETYHEFLKDLELL